MSWYGEPGRHALARRGIKTTGSLARKIVLRRLAERVDTGNSADFLGVSLPPFRIPVQGMYHRSPIEDSPVKRIPIKGIRTWQGEFSTEAVVWNARNPRNLLPTSEEGAIEVIYDDINDQYWIYDGNHRVIAAKLLGQQTIEAKVLTISGKRNSRLGCLPDTTMSHPELGPI